LRDDIESSEILPWGYCKSRAGGVLLAVYSRALFQLLGKINFYTDLELVTVELRNRT
jgi:hypothetical protein